MEHAGIDLGAAKEAAARKWWTLVAVSVGTFMLLLDITIVNVALPEIQRDLGASFTDLQWVVDSYALALASLTLIAGSLADRLGRRRVFGFGLAAFTAASLLAGLAPDSLTLNVARGLQGIGGAVMFGTVLALIAQEFQGRDRATALGVWGATAGASVAIGPLVGGAVTEGLGWEWIFFLNLPVGLAALAITFTRVAESVPSRAGRLDWLGLLTFASALFALVFGLLRGSEEGWTSPMILGLLVGSAVLLAVFARIELRAERPMLDVRLFRIPAFTGASVAALTLAASLFAMLLYLVLYLQNALGHSPLGVGVRLLPITVLAFFLAPLAAKLSERFGPRLFIGCGLALIGAGLLAMRVGPDSEWTALVAGFVLAGVGGGLVNPTLADAAIGVVEPARAGMATGINNTFRQVGVATGIAVLGAFFQRHVAISELQGTVDAAAREAFVSGFNEILVVAASVAFVGAVASLGLIRKRDFRHGAARRLEPAREAAPAGAIAA